MIFESDLRMTKVKKCKKSSSFGKQKNYWMGKTVLNFFSVWQNSNNRSESRSLENLFVPEQQLSRAALGGWLESPVDVFHEEILLVAVESFHYRVNLVLFGAQQHFDHQRCCRVLKNKKWKILKTFVKYNATN